MSHLPVNPDEPGIRGLFRFRPEAAVPLNSLVESRCAAAARSPAASAAPR